MNKLTPYKISKNDLLKIKDKMIKESSFNAYNDRDLNHIADVLEKAFKYLKEERLQDVGFELEVK